MSSEPNEEQALIIRDLIQQHNLVMEELHAERRSHNRTKSILHELSDKYNAISAKNAKLRDLCAELLVVAGKELGVLDADV